MGRVRMVATREELNVVNAMESAIGDWEVGHPAPDSFGAALQRLRVMVEGLGPTGKELVNEDNATSPDAPTTDVPPSLSNH